MVAKNYLVDFVDSVYWSVTLMGDDKHNSVKTALEGLQTELSEHGTTPPHPLDPHTNTNIAASRRALPAVEVGKLHYKTVELGKCVFRKSSERTCTLESGHYFATFLLLLLVVVLEYLLGTHIYLGSFI